MLFSPYIIYISKYILNILPQVLSVCVDFFLFFLIVHPKKKLYKYINPKILTVQYTFFFSGRISTCGWRYEIVLCLYQCSLLPQMGWQNWKINYICNSNIFYVVEYFLPKERIRCKKKSKDKPYLVFPYEIVNFILNSFIILIAQNYSYIYNPS